MFTDSIFREGFDFYHAPQQLSIPLNKLPCVWRLYRVRQFLDIRVRCHWLLNLCPDRRPQGPRRPGVRYHIYDNMNSLPSPALNRWLMRNPWKDLEKKETMALIHIQWELNHNFGRWSYLMAFLDKHGICRRNMSDRLVALIVLINWSDIRHNWFKNYMMKLHLNLVAQIEVIRYKNISNSKIVALTNVCRNRIIKP